MKIYSDVSTGLRTVYPCPASTRNRFAKVGGVVTALASQTDTSVTFAVAPAAGAVVDIFYGNDIVVPPSTFTASGVSVNLPPPVDMGLTLFLNVTAATATSTLDVKVQVLDEISGLWIDVPGAVFATATAISTASLTIFRGAAAVANASVNRAIHNPYRVAYTIGGAGASFTFSVGAQP